MRIQEQRRSLLITRLVRRRMCIWEPIFALLAANHVQLIVPARGATTAITGRFDVNYILGQQMAGGKQLTVVVDYTSKVEQEELVYQDLEYEQVSFDFI